MKATVRDSQTLNLPKPEDIEQYLVSRDWNRLRASGPFGAIYNREVDGSQYELLVPSTKEISDFPQRISEILGTLEILEKRSQIEILSDLTSIRSDIVRIRRPEALDGTLPLDDGVSLIQSASDMILAAACTAVSPRLYYQGKRPERATEFLRKARLGQSERGSYVVTVISPLPPPEQQPKNLFGTQAPFERHVTTLLSNGLEATIQASEYALRNLRTDHFREATREGVSANLLDAVLGLMGTDRVSVGVKFAWSPQFPVVEGANHTIVIEPDFAPVISEASRFLKEQEPLPPVEMVGVVIALRRPEGMTQGRATLMAFVEGRTRNVSVELAPEYYDIAITAHRERRAVVCKGELVRMGRLMILTKVLSFNMAPPFEEEERPPGLIFPEG